MKFVLEIECDNDSFTAEWGDEEERALEVARILEGAAEKLRRNQLLTEFPLSDHNDNVVGLASFVD